MVGFICNLCWHNGSIFLNSMINIFIFRCVEPDTFNNYYNFADRLTQNNSPDCPFNKKLSSLHLTKFANRLVFQKDITHMYWSPSLGVLPYFKSETRQFVLSVVRLILSLLLLLKLLSLLCSLSLWCWSCTLNRS